MSAPTPTIMWIERADSGALMWGHVKVGDISKGGNGTWYAHYLDDCGKMRGLKDFTTFDGARLAIENALRSLA